MAFRPIRPTISYQNDSISFKKGIASFYKILAEIMQYTETVFPQDIKYVSVKYKNRGKIRNI